MLASGANVPGCTGAHTPTVACGSLTVTFVSVTLPVFVTTRSYVIGSPTPYGPVDVSLFVTFKAGLWVNVTVSSSVSGPVSLLSAVAVLVKLPASRSACVTPELAGQVMLASGANVPGCTGAHTPTVACGSLTVTFVSVTLPVFVTTRSYVIGSPTPYGPVDVSLFVTFKAGLWVNVTVSSSVSGPVSLLSAVAVLVKLPASRSACVTP